MSDFLSESERREKVCSRRSTEALIQWAVLSGAFYGGSAALLHQFYQPFRKINFRFKVIPVCMLTLGTSYFRSEQALMACRREQGQIGYEQERKERAAKWAERKKSMENVHHVEHESHGQPAPSIKSPSSEHHKNY